MPEQILLSESPLKDAILILGGIDLVAKSRGKQLVMSKCPKKDTTTFKSITGMYVVGLRGTTTSRANGSYHIGNGGKERQTIKIGLNDKWEIRWDYDEDKGSHVNVKVGSNKFAVVVSVEGQPRSADRYWDAIIYQTPGDEYTDMSASDEAYWVDNLVDRYKAILDSNAPR